MFCPNYYYDSKYNYVDNTRVILYDEVTPENLMAAWNTIRASPQYSTLMWFDDCMGQSGMRCNELTRILINIRHNNTSCVALVQEIVGVAPVFRRQCEAFISFQTQDEDDRNMVIKNFGIGNKYEFLKMYDECTREKHNFMLMNRQGANVLYYHNFTPINNNDQDNDQIQHRSSRKRKPSKKILPSSPYSRHERPPLERQHKAKT